MLLTDLFTHGKQQDQGRKGDWCMSLANNRTHWYNVIMHLDAYSDWLIGSTPYVVTAWLNTHSASPELDC